MLEHKPNSIFESARKVLEHSQVQLKEGSFDKADEVKSLEALIKNPDPKRVKEYGGTKYVDMLKAKLDKLTNESTNLEEIAGAELTEAISPQVEKIIYLVKELPTTDIKAFLDELATVFDQKADEEDSDDLPDIYRRVSKHIDNAFSVWFQEALDKL